MAIKNLGNFKKTIGVYNMTLDKNGVELEFENGYNGKDMINFQEALEKKDNELIRKFLIEHLDKNGMFKDFDEDSKLRFVVENLEDLVTEYMVMMRLANKEEIKKELEKVKKESKQKSPIEQ